MNNVILPAILLDADIRTAEATRLAYEVVMFGKPEVTQPIARYGQFVDNAQAVPAITMKDFMIAVAGLRIYQETIAPLRSYRTQLDDFDDKFALAVFRLLKK